MEITSILETITVICFLIFVWYESMTMQKIVYKVPGVWSLSIKRIGRKKQFWLRRDMASKLSLQPGIYRVGTGRLNDIRVYGCKSEVNLYLDINEQELLLTVLKGEVEIGGIVLKADASIQKHISKDTTIFIDGMRIDLKKEES